jgi:dUTP pyrophosphatase
MAENVIKIRLDGGVLPIRGTSGAAGYDISCKSNFTIEPGEQITLHTGLYMELPSGTYAELRTRSSMALLRVRVEAGIIDSDYRGEVCVLLYNYGKEKFENTNKRIAQMIIHPVGKYNLVEGEINKTERKGGFGSTN